MKKLVILIFVILMLVGCKEYDSIIKPTKISVAYNPDIKPANFDQHANADFGWKSVDVINRREINWLKVEFDIDDVAGKYLLTPSSRFAYRVIYNNEVFHPFSGDYNTLYAKSYRSHPYIFEIEDNVSVIYVYFERSSMHFGFMIDELAIGNQQEIRELALKYNKNKLVKDQIDFYSSTNLMIIGFLSIMIFFMLHKKDFSLIIFGFMLSAAGIFHLRISPFSVYLNDPSIGRRISVFGFILLFYVLFITFTNSFFRIKKKYLNIILSLIIMILVGSAILFDNNFEWIKLLAGSLYILLTIQVYTALRSNHDLDRGTKIVLFLGFSINTFIMSLGMLDHFFRLKLFISPISLGLNAIAISLVYYMIKNYRSQLLELEHSRLKLVALQKENLTAELISLKQQIDPHFLFNSLSTLISLIEESKSSAQDFVQELSKVYRFILKIKNKDLIQVKEEIRFVESYLFLLSHRFKKNLVVEFNLDQEINYNLVVPASIQMLIENCVKHNVVSNDKPLRIKVFNDADYIVVENNYQPKLDEIDSPRIGLNNLRQRFSYFTEIELKVETSENSFRVMVPIIKEID
ncbi:MAG: histidine kinase [Candidatus Tenebribacter davisii]|nr:histidine kinase [Candidatus Tenebribacter davisii]